MSVHRFVLPCLPSELKRSQTPPVLKRNLKHIFIIKNSVLTVSRCFSFSSISINYHFSFTLLFSLFLLVFIVMHCWTLFLDPLANLFFLIGWLADLND